MPDKNAMRLGGLILTGGRSQRMGRAKESLPIAGTTMLGRQCATLAACADPVVVVARNAQQLLPELPHGTDVICDRQPGHGPLAAIATGLHRLRDRHGFTDTDAAFVTACDLPYLTSPTVRWLRDRLGEHTVVMPRADGLLQPMAAVLRLAALPHTEQLLANGARTPRSLADSPDALVLEEVELRAHDPELRFLRNVNEPDDYRRALDELA